MDNLKNGLAADSSVFSKMIRWQLLATLVVAVLAFLIASKHAGLSALAGGFSVILGAFVASKIAQRSQNSSDATNVLVNLLKAEAVKILIIVALLFVTFKLYKELVPFALIAGLAAAALLSGAAMSKLEEDI